MTMRISTRTGEGVKRLAQRNAELRNGFETLGCINLRYLSGINGRIAARGFQIKGIDLVSVTSSISPDANAKRFMIDPRREVLHILGNERHPKGKTSLLFNYRVHYFLLIMRLACSRKNVMIRT